MTFPTMNPALERALTARAYTELTAVQLAVLEPHAIGQDMLVSAQTGSGKTVAFGLTMAPKLLGESERFERAAEPLALIIAPTRELAMQVQRELEWLFAETGAKIATCVGGMDPKTERIALAQGAHIVVGTPGRLRDHLERRRLDTSKLRCVVLDEADEMLDLGFREDLQFILDTTPAERQTLMFSATVPREIETLARGYQRDAIRIETAVRNQAHADIEYRAIRIPPATIEATVVNLLRFFDARATLVFCATREGVRLMHQGLVDRGFACVALSGDLSQADRTSALDSLREGNAKVLVATDVAARGLDLPELTLVIHADLPNDRETLLHRSGRTGRAGRKGISILIVPPNRRRKAETLIGAARVDAVWGAAPSAKQIAAKDQERLLEMPILDELATAEDLELGRTLLEGRTPEQLAAALVRIHRASLPVPEDIRAMPVERPERSYKAGASDRKPSDHKTWAERRDDARGVGAATRNQGEQRAERAPRAAPAESSGYTRPPRENPSREGMVWFGLNIGREKNADPRWLLPLICRVGDVTKKEIGSIKIADRQTTFEIAEAHADQFALAVQASRNKEGKIWRIDGAEPAAAVDAPRPHVAKPYKPKARSSAPPETGIRLADASEPVEHATRDVKAEAIQTADVHATLQTPAEARVPAAVEIQAMAAAEPTASSLPADVTASPIKAKQFSDGTIGMKRARAEPVAAVDVVVATSSSEVAATDDAKVDGDLPAAPTASISRPAKPFKDAKPFKPATSFKPEDASGKPREAKAWDKPKSPKTWDSKPRDTKPRDTKPRDTKPGDWAGDGKPRESKPWQKRSDAAPEGGKKPYTAKTFKPSNDDRAPASAKDGEARKPWQPATHAASRTDDRPDGKSAYTRSSEGAPRKPRDAKAWDSKPREFNPRDANSRRSGPRDSGPRDASAAPATDSKARTSKPWEKRPGAADGDKKPYQASKYVKSDERKPAGAGASKPWASKSRDSKPSFGKPWEKRASGASDGGKSSFHAGKTFNANGRKPPAGKSAGGASKGSFKAKTTS